MRAAPPARSNSAALRTIYLGDGLDGLEKNLERARRETLDHIRRDRAARRMWDADWESARDHRATTR